MRFQSVSLREASFPRAGGMRFRASGTCGSMSLRSLQSFIRLICVIRGLNQFRNNDRRHPQPGHDIAGAIQLSRERKIDNLAATSECSTTVTAEFRSTAVGFTVRERKTQGKGVDVAFRKSSQPQNSRSTKERRGHNRTPIPDRRRNH